MLDHPVREQQAGPWLRPLSASLDAPGAALLRTLTGHVGKENTVAVTADGRLVVGSAGNTLRVRDLASGRELRSLVGHGDSVTALALTPDGRLAVSGSADNTLKLWDLESGRGLRTLTGHTDLVSAVALTADGRVAVSAQGEALGRESSLPADTRLRVWDVASGREVRVLAGHAGVVSCVAITPDGQLAVSAARHTLKVWDVASGKELRTLTGHTHEVSCVAITPDGRLAVSAAWDGTLKVWDVVLGKELRTLTGHGLGFSTVAITADGRLAVSGSDDRTIKVWEVASGRELQHPHRPYGLGQGSGSDARRAAGRLGIVGWDAQGVGFGHDGCKPCARAVAKLLVRSPGFRQGRRADPGRPVRHLGLEGQIVDCLGRAGREGVVLPGRSQGDRNRCRDDAGWAVGRFGIRRQVAEGVGPGKRERATHLVRPQAGD